jgi:transcriptional regulator with XRE-family HTH domain
VTSASDAPDAPAEEEAELPDVGAQLQAAARARGFNRNKIARLAGLSRPTVESALAGADIRLSTLQRLMNVLHMDTIRMGSGRVELDIVAANALRAALTGYEELEREVARRRERVAKLLAEAESRREVTRLISDIAADARKRAK